MRFFKSSVFIWCLILVPAGVFGQNFEAISPSFSFNISKNSSEGKRKDYALLIANENFDDKRIQSLNNPSFDVKSISKRLSENFGFETEIIVNTEKNELIKVLREYAKKAYQKNDQLFIFFAGHGEFDPVFRQGYVVMKDSQFKDETYSEYLSFAFLQDILNKINCNHILLSLDVCYGGTFDNYFAARDNTLRGEDYRGLEYSETQEGSSLTAFIYDKLKPVARVYLSSGGNEVVPDGKKGEHSPFAKAFLEKLDEASVSQYKILTAGELKVYLEKQTYKVKMGGFGDNESNSDFLFIAQ